MKQKIRAALQGVFLLIFLALIFTGKMQVWMIVIFASIVLAALFGRFYCGWVCPLHTLMRPVEFLTARLKYKRRSVPEWAYSPSLRYVIPGVTVFLIAMTLLRGLKFPLLIALVPFAIGFTFFFHSSLWHRCLCPFGIVLSLTGRFSPLRVRVDPQECNSCKKCVQICPAEGVSIPMKKGPALIDSRFCLECFLCQDVCARRAISFSPSRKKGPELEIPGKSTDLEV